MSTTTFTKTASITAALALALAGCSLGDGPTMSGGSDTSTPSSSSTSESGTSPSSSSPSPSPSSSPASSNGTSDNGSESSGPSVGQFGETATYKDGLTVTVTEPGPYQPSSYAAGTEQHSQFVKFDVTVTNGTEKVYDLPVEMMIDVSSGSSPASQVFDSGKGLNGALDAAKVLPGDSATLTVAYGVNDPQDVTVQVTPGFKYSTSFFKGQK